MRAASKPTAPSEGGSGFVQPIWTAVQLTGSVLAVQVAAGSEHTCALTDAGGVRCWGNNSFGQLGDGTTTSRATPMGVSGLASGVRAIAAGYAHTCAVTADGQVKCWGSNSSGQLGDDTMTSRATPVDVSGLAGDNRAIAVDDEHTCALTEAGGVRYWGNIWWSCLAARRAGCRSW